MIYLSFYTENSDNRVFYRCPKCSELSVHFVVVPEKCGNCGHGLQDPGKMETNISARCNYYTFGEY